MSNSLKVPKVAMKSKKKTRYWRLTILVFVLIITTVLGLLHQYGQFKTVGIDALCPFGAIVSAYDLMFTGVILKRIALSSFILLVAVIAIALVFRRAFCGLICPLGTLQELFGRMGKKILGRHFTIPRWLDQPARYLKYVILLLVIIFTILTGQLVFRPYDPWITYHHITSPELFTEFLLGFIILLLTIVGSFFFDRFFCKYLCPMGAFLAPFNKLGWFGIKRNKESCINCQACNRVCPMQINVAQSSKINQLECIGCNECVNVCPARDTLYVAGPRDKKKITPGLVNILVVAILIIIIGTTTATGDFQWKIPTLKEQVIQAGEIDSSLIKGKMTLQEIADAYQIPAQFLVEKLGVNEEDFHKPLKEINEKYGLTTETVRLIVDEYIKK